MFGMKLETNEIMEASFMQQSGHPVTAITFVPRNHQVSIKTLLVVLPQNPKQKETSQVTSSASSCAPSWRAVSLSRLFQRESSTCTSPATALRDTGHNSCLTEKHFTCSRSSCLTLAAQRVGVVQNYSLTHTHFPCGSAPAPK